MKIETGNLSQAAWTVHGKGLQPELNSSEFFQMLNSHPEFQWRVPPFPTMGNDLENLVRLQVMHENKNRRIVNLEVVTGVILARLSHEFPNRTIIGIDKDEAMVRETNEVLARMSYSGRARVGSPVCPDVLQDDLIVTALNVTDQERLIQHLLQIDFQGDLLCYRYQPPGPAPYKVYNNGAYPWVHYKFDDMGIAQWKTDQLAIVIGTQRYAAVQTLLHINKTTDNLQVRVSESLSEWLNVRLGNTCVTSGAPVSCELAFYATGPHQRRIVKGTVELFDKSNTPASRLDVIVVAAPMVEPGLARWEASDSMTIDTIEKFFETNDFHALVNWASNGMKPPYDYY